MTYGLDFVDKKTPHQSASKTSSKALCTMLVPTSCLMWAGRGAGLASISLAKGVGLVWWGDTTTSEKKRATDEEGVAGDPISDRDGVLA